MSYAVSLRQRGLSLLELLVAFAIMAIALGMLYKASGSSARSVGEIQSYQRAVSLAESLLATRDAIPPDGWNESGQSAGFLWQVRSRPYATPVAQGNLGVPLLHAVDMTVGWSERGLERRIELHTLRPQRSLPTDAGGKP